MNDASAAAAPRRCPRCMSPATEAAKHCGHCGLRLDAAVASESPLAPGHRLAGRYEVGLPLGRTAYGMMLVAWDHALQQRCAVSECLVLRSADAAFELAELWARAPTPSAAADPVFAPVLDFVAADGLGYFVLSHADGEALGTAASLQEALDSRGRPFDASEATALLEPALAAIERRHAAGRLHGLFGPDCVFPGADGLRILDFGPASLVVGAAPGVRAALAPAAAPPELSQDSPASQATDVYLLGALLYQATAGRPPAEAVAAATLLGAGAELRFALEKSLARRPADRVCIGDSAAAGAGFGGAVGERLQGRSGSPFAACRRIPGRFCGVGRRRLAVLAVGVGASLERGPGGRARIRAGRATAARAAAPRARSAAGARRGPAGDPQLYGPARARAGRRRG